MVVTTCLLMVSSGAATLVHPSTTLTAPYKGTLSSPNTFTSVNGCAGAKVTSPPKWAATSGLFTGAATSKATACAKQLGNVGGSSFGDSGAGISLAIPFRVASNGNHSVQLNWAFTIASTRTSTSGGCPTSKVTFPPPPSSSAFSYCEAGSTVDMFVDAQVQDLNNASWFSNFSYVDTFNETFWENFTDCFNFGTPSCSNNTGFSNFSFGFGFNQVGKISFSGASALTMWTNGTKMVRSHHYVIDLSISFGVESFVAQFNLASHWAASSAASLNMATLGNGAKLGSVVIT